MEESGVLADFSQVRNNIQLAEIRDPYNVDSGGGDRVKVTWGNGSEHDWHHRSGEEHHYWREEHNIPTEAMWDVMRPDEKAETTNRLLKWADEVGVPNNSQIREVLGGLVRKLAEEWMLDCKSQWKALANVASGSKLSYSSQISPQMHFL